MKINLFFAAQGDTDLLEPLKLTIIAYNNLINTLKIAFNTYMRKVTDQQRLTTKEYQELGAYLNKQLVKSNNDKEKAVNQLTEEALAKLDKAYFFRQQKKQTAELLRQLINLIRRGSDETIMHYRDLKNYLAA